MKTPPEATYHKTPKERRARVLSRLALTRAEFTADHSPGENAGKELLHRPAPITVSLLPKQSRGSILLASPNAQTITAVLVCSVIFGPRRLFALVGLPIVRAWATRAVRNLITAPKAQGRKTRMSADSAGAITE
ncbi:hypothetical protein [Caballeronia sordidicola]|uniref:hypothetical protein n=1 Tax=Caballeronia sordidicola TaxID=196367 RepID=UPI00117CE110|nr:hypothetical protein [Caballeronia sordidicola]